LKAPGFNPCVYEVKTGFKVCSFEFNLYRYTEWSHIPVDNGEGIQVLRYKVGQKYEQHMVRAVTCVRGYTAPRRW
jgi:hypothetical protein